MVNHGSIKDALPKHVVPPDQLHFGQADAILAARQTTLDTALHAPRSGSSASVPPPQVPTAAWINPPKKTKTAEAKLKNQLSQSR